MINKSDIGTRLSHARGEAGLSRRKLADRSGISTALVQKYEENKCRFSIYSFCKICRELEVDPLQILDPDIYDKFFSRQDGDVEQSLELQGQAFHEFLTNELLTDDVLDFFKEHLPSEMIADLLAGTSESQLAKKRELYKALSGDMSPEITDLIDDYCSLNRRGRKLLNDFLEALIGNPTLRI